MVVEELLPTETMLADPHFAALPPTSQCGTKGALQSKGGHGRCREQDLTRGVVRMGTCGAEQISYMDGKIICLSAK